MFINTQLGGTVLFLIHISKDLFVLLIYKLYTFDININKSKS